MSEWTNKEDIVWSATTDATITHASIWESRKLTKWERFKVHVLRRPDPIMKSICIKLYTHDDDAPLSQSEVDTLAKYNSERSRGILHTVDWNDKMLVLQHRYDNEYVPYMKSTKDSH